MGSLDEEKMTLVDWLRAIKSAKKDSNIIDYEFPSDCHREEYLKGIDKRSEDEVIELVKKFLVPSCSLGIDQTHLQWLLKSRTESPDIHQRLLKMQYYQRLILLPGALKGKRPFPWEGITWILDLLPHFPKECLAALRAYLLAHAQLLPDGRFRGLGNAAELIRVKFISSPETVADKIELLMSVTPRDLECIVERLYSAMGYNTILTNAKKDGGKDIVASKQADGQRENVLIECKQYTKPVGVEKMRGLLGVVSDNKANKGTLVTTSSFTAGAKKMAAGNHRLDTIDGQQLVTLLNEHLGPKWPDHVDRLITDSLGGKPMYR